MASTKVTTPKDIDYPVTFEVTNTGRRTRSRLGRNFHAARGDDKPKPVRIEVTSVAEYLRLKGCKDLQLKPASSKGKGTPSDDPVQQLVDEHDSDELKAMAADRELSTSGTKAELAARIVDHDAAAGGGGE